MAALGLVHAANGEPPTFPRSFLEDAAISSGETILPLLESSSPPAYVTVNVAALVPVPLEVVTLIFPVSAPVGTVAVI